MSLDAFAEEGLSPKAEHLLRGGGIGQYVTNSVLTSFFVSLSIVLAVRFITRRGVSLVPSKGQMLVEGVIDGLGGIFEPILGRHLFLKLFPLLFGYFVFILINNFSGLFPGIGSIGFEKNGAFEGIFRPMNADLNATLSMAIIATIAWLYFSLKFVGAKGLYAHIFGNKAEKSEIHVAMYSVLFLIFFGVGFVECLSILFRIISLSFRLYGNIFGGENLLHNIYEMSEFVTSGGLLNTDFFASISSLSSGLAHFLNFFVSKLGYLLPLPFYFLELLVGTVQAFVFTLLVAVYIGLICNHEEDKNGTADV